MEIKILEVKEEGNSLRVVVETEYGVDNVGLSLQSKYKDPFTGKPRWQGEVQELLQKKYPLKDGIVPVTQIHEEFVNKTFSLENFKNSNPEDGK